MDIHHFTFGAETFQKNIVQHTQLLRFRLVGINRRLFREASKLVCVGDKRVIYHSFLLVAAA